MKKITIVSEFLPTFKEFGGSINLIWTIKGLIRKKYRVSIICFKNLNFYEDKTSESLNYLKNLGISKVIQIEGQKEKYHENPNIRRIQVLKNLFFYSDYIKNNSLLLQNELSKSKADFFLAQPDVLKFLNFNLSDKLIASWIGHPGYPFFEINYTFTKKSFYKYLSFKIRKYIFARTIAKSLNRMKFCIGSPKFWVNEWQKKLKFSKVYNTPTFTEYVPELKIKINKSKKINVVILGSPNAGLTKMGLYFYEKKIWPNIVLRNLQNQIKVSVIGKLINEDSLIKSLKSKSVIFLGFVKNIDKIINEADIVLISNNLSPGAGSKLATLSSLSACLLVHRVLIESHNEFRDGFNCLAAEDGHDFVDKIIYLKQNPNLRLKLKRNARKTFERFFTTERFLSKLECLYEKYNKRNVLT